MRLVQDYIFLAMEPGEVAVRRPPPPVRVEAIGPAILGATEALIDERALRGVVNQSPPFVPYPLPLGQIAVLRVPAAAAPRRPRQHENITQLHQEQQQHEEDGRGRAGREGEGAGHVLERLRPPPQPQKHGLQTEHPHFSGSTVVIVLGV